MHNRDDLIAIAYLGRRGGGATFFEDVRLDMCSLHPNVVSIVALESDVRIEGPGRVMRVDTPHSFSDLIKIHKSFVSFFRAASSLHKEQIAEVVFLMPQPLDYWFARILRMHSIKVSYVIHDHQSHSGEWWPRRKSMASRIKISSRVFFLSHYVASYFEVEVQNKISYVSKLETKYRESVLDYRMPATDGKYFIIIGRMKSYKGVDRLLRVWQEIKMKDFSLIIAGQGSSAFERQSARNANVHFIDKWLTETEIRSLIANSSGLIAPYENATQSGIVSMATQFGIPVLATKTGGLVEQLSGIVNAVLVENDENSLVEGLKILRRFNGLRVGVSPQNDSPMEISTLIAARA